MVPASFQSAEFADPRLDRSFFVNLARKIAQSGTDVVYFSGYRVSGFLVAEALHRYAPKVRLMGPELYDVDLIKVLGTGAEGILSTFPGEVPGRLPPGAEAVLAKYKAVYGQALGDGPGGPC